MENLCTTVPLPLFQSSPDALPDNIDAYRWLYIRGPDFNFNFNDPVILACLCGENFNALSQMIVYMFARVTLLLLEHGAL